MTNTGLQLRVALICPKMALADPARNLQTLRHWVERASEQRADLVVFPEAFISGYAERFMIEAGSTSEEGLRAAAEPVPGPSTDAILETSRELGIAICAGLIERDGDQYFNTQVMIDPDHGLLGCYRKTHVGPNERWLFAGGTEWPVFDIGGIPTGILLCRDKSHPEAARILALNGAQLLLIPHSSTQAEGMEFTSWSLKICVARAMENGCYVLSNNNIYDCPMANGRNLAGYSFAVDPFGEVIHCDEGPPDTEKMAIVTINPNKVADRRNAEGPGFNLETRQPGIYSSLTDPAR